MSYRACKASVSMPAAWPYLVYALFMPCLCLVYALFMGSMYLVCGYSVICKQPCQALPLIPRPSGTPFKGGRAGICGCGFSCPFLLIGKDQRIKADIKGLPHLATAPPPCRPGPRAQPGRSLAFPHTRSVVVASFLNGILPAIAVIAGADPRSPMFLGFAPVVALRHREARSDPFMIDLCKIYFQ